MCAARLKSATSRTKTFWFKLAAVGFAAGLWTVVSRSVPMQYETPPPSTNSIRWEDHQRVLKQRQELTRPRIAINPEAMSPDVPRVGSLNADKSRC